MNNPNQADPLQELEPKVSTTVPPDNCGPRIDAFLRELVTYYDKDPIAPGLQIAWIAEKEAFYVAVHRFPTRAIASRMVVSKAVEATLELAVGVCSEVWRNLMKQQEAS